MPTKQLLTELGSSTSLRTWTTQLNTVESRAAEHERYGSELVTQLVDPLKAIAVKFEDLRKRHAEHANKLEADRDSSFNDLRKLKSKYDSCCQEVENKRKKAESSFDFSKLKAQNAYQQQVMEMHNAKNIYLIAISVTNAQKEKYYHDYVPDLLDSLQDLSQSRTTKLNEIWSLATQIETDMLKRNIQLLDHLAIEIKKNDPLLDSAMFVEHNLSPWQEPPGKTFIPSPIWHDDSEIVVDEMAVVFLRNVLAKSKAQLGDLRREVDKKRRDIESAKRTKQQIREGKVNTDEVEIVKSIYAQQEELHTVDHKRLAAEVETNIITAVVGDITVGTKSHNFKSQIFKIPTNCDLCSERIWGISGKGFECRDCSYTCHSRCEMKVPAECPGEQNKEQKKKLKLERQEAAHSLTSTIVPRPSMDISDKPKSYSNPTNLPNSGYTSGVLRSISNVKAPVEKTSESTNNSLHKGAALQSTVWKNRIVAPPPSSYINDLQGSKVASKNIVEGEIGDERRAKMIYNYEANGEGEVSVEEGNEVVILEYDGASSYNNFDMVLTVPDGGWTKVRTSSRECGLVPTSYIEIIEPRPVSIISNSGFSIGGQKKPGPPVAPKRGAKKLKVFEALYDYTAQNEAELSITEGERVILVKMDPGDGWVEVEKGGRVGNVPSSYIQAVD